MAVKSQLNSLRGLNSALKQIPYPDRDPEGVIDCFAKGTYPGTRYASSFQGEILDMYPDAYILSRQNAPSLHGETLDWIVDLGDMTCRNINYGFVVHLERKSGTFKGKIKEMPIDVMRYWSRIPHGYKFVKKSITDAENAFIKAYYAEKENLGDAPYLSSGCFAC